MKEIVIEYDIQIYDLVEDMGELLKTHNLNLVRRWEEGVLFLSIEPIRSYLLKKEEQ